MLHGCQFSNDEEVEDAVCTLHHAQLETSFTDDIRNFVDKSNTCVVKLGD